MRHTEIFCIVFENVLYCYRDIAGAENRSFMKKIEIRDGVDIQRLCDMAALRLSEEEAEKLKHELDALIEFASAVCGAEECGAEHETVIPGELCAVFRKDTVHKGYDRDVMLSSAAAKDRGCPYVPKVIE